MRRKVFLLVLTLTALWGGIHLPQVFAASTPEVFITWRTRTFVPNGYQGKALPTANSLIDASLEVLDQGQSVDLSKQTIYWYTDNHQVLSATNKQIMSLRAPDYAFNPIALRVEIPTYQGGGLIKQVTIPVIYPEVIIQGPNVVSNSSTTLRGLPYFFNTDFIENLLFTWTVNGETASGAGGTPDILNAVIQGPSGSSVNVELRVNNPLRPLEAVQKLFTLGIK